MKSSKVAELPSKFSEILVIFSSNFICLISSSRSDFLSSYEVISVALISVTKRKCAFDSKKIGSEFISLTARELILLSKGSGKI